MQRNVLHADGFKPPSFETTMAMIGSKDGRPDHMRVAHEGRREFSMGARAVRRASNLPAQRAPGRTAESPQ